MKMRRLISPIVVFILAQFAWFALLALWIYWYVRNYSQRYQISRDEVPDTKPMLERIIGDNDGLIFVFPLVTGAPSGSVVDVFRDSGVFLGRIALPVRLEVLAHAPSARGGFLYGITKDEFDVQYVVRLRIGRRME